jgi:hypothetical protein
VIAAFLTIWVTRRIANRQIAASREDADRVVAAARAQTEATFKQTDATITLDQLHDASEALAFHAMLAAAMDRVRAEAAWARKTYPLTWCRRQARRSRPLLFVSASPRAHSRNCAPRASGAAET